MCVDSGTGEGGGETGRVLLHKNKFYFYKVSRFFGSQVCSCFVMEMGQPNKAASQCQWITNKTVGHLKLSINKRN